MLRIQRKHINEEDMSATTHGWYRQRIDVVMREATAMAQALGQKVDEPNSELPAAVTKALQWMELRSVDERIAEREKLICRIEAMAAQCRETGECDRWFASADSILKGVSMDVNGPLLEKLANAVG